MKNSLDNANKLTLNVIQKSLNIHYLSKPAFLRMIFPDSLCRNDSTGCLDFIFNSDSSYQNSRSTFMTGNITKHKKTSTYSRAHQTELNYIAKQFNTVLCFDDMTELLKNNFKSLHIESLISLSKIDYSLYPCEFSTSVNNAVQNGDTYTLLALLILWSVFGERITLIHMLNTSDIKDIKEDYFIISPYENIIKYFNENMQNIHQIESVEFCFIAGSRWLMDDERIEIMQNLLKNRIKMRVLICQPDVAAYFTEHMKNPNKIYVSFDNSISMWNDFNQKNSDLVEVKVSPLPPMRNYCSFNMKNGGSSLIFALYTYGNPYFNKNFFNHLRSDSHYFAAIKNEFDYLWNISKDISMFL